MSTASYYPQTGNSSSGDNSGRLLTIQHGTTNDALPDFLYHYDPVGNISALQTTVRPVGYSYNFYDLQSFLYDEQNRLDWAGGSHIPQAGFTGYSQDYAYDLLGNLTQMGSTSLQYNDPTHKHAATHRNGSNPVLHLRRQWQYDAARGR